MTIIFRAPIITGAIRARFAAPAEYVVNVIPLLYPNPRQPFVQSDWPRPQNPKPVLASDAPANLSPSYFPPPLPPAAPTIFRAPLIVTIPARLAAPAEYVVNLTLLNPAFPVGQSDWPRPQGPGRVQASDAPANLFPNYFPNPKVPFSQAMWESAKPPLPKATGEAFTLSLLLTPSRPFNQYEWRLPARTPLSLKSDVYWQSFPIYSPNPSAPFHQNLWENAAKSLPRAYLETAGAPATLYIQVQPQAQPFSQDNWEAAARPLLKAVVDSIIYQPALAQPFNQGDWTTILKPTTAKVDDFVNLLPTQTGAAIVIPFHQGDWPSASRTPISLKSDIYVGPSPLVSPNPAQPFTQSLWDNATPYKAKANTGEAVSGLYALYGPTRLPFAQPLWENATLARSKVNPGEAVTAPLYPAYYPNPKQPFSQGDWPLSVLAPRPSDRGFVESINFSLSPPPPPVAKLEARAFFVTMGGLTVLPQE